MVSARVIIRMFGVPDAQTDAMSEEEIKIIINNSYNGGIFNQPNWHICKISFHSMKHMQKI